jgi:hypothetical protein
MLQGRALSGIFRRHLGSLPMRFLRVKYVSTALARFDAKAFLAIICFIT